MENSSPTWSGRADPPPAPLAVKVWNAAAPLLPPPPLAHMPSSAALTSHQPPLLFCVRSWLKFAVCMTLVVAESVTQSTEVSWLPVAGLSCW